MFVVIYIYCNITYIIYSLSNERPRMGTSDCLEEQTAGVRSREYRAAMLVSKTGSVEVSGRRALCRTGFLGLELGALSERLKTNSHECCHPASARRVPVRTGPQTWHGPSDLGVQGVTRVPPEGWAEAPGEEPHTLPL